MEVESYCKILPIELTAIKCHEVLIYYPDDVIGKGSYSTTYRAKCDQLPCAAKYYPCESTKEEVIVRMEIACQLVSAIRHPNIVQCLGTVRHGVQNRPILMLELMDESLSQLLERYRKMSLNVPYYIKVNICHDTALGLAYLHTNAIVHANLTSNNVLIVGESRAKITDFWSLDLMEINPQMKLFHGNKDDYKSVYMAPEVLCNSPTLSHQSDSFSFGVLTIQVDTQCLPDPKVELAAEVERCKTGTLQDSPFIPLALECLHDNPLQRAEIKSVCQDLDKLKSSTDYCDSLGDSRGFQKCAEEVKKIGKDMVSKDMIINQMEQELLHLNKENDKLVKTNQEHEVFEKRLLATSPIGSPLNMYSHSEDQPDSTDGYGVGIHNIEKVELSIPLFMEQIGCGENGVIYRGTWGVNNTLQLVAFKKFKKQRDSEDWKEKLKYEVKNLCQLDHPNIAKVYEAVLIRDNVGIVMELLSCSLSHAMSEWQIPEDKKRKIIRQVSEGLEYLHSKGVVHCNLTSANILLQSDYSAKIGSYGPKFLRSKFESIYDLTGQVDPLYAAPEILKREPLPLEKLKKADMYSLAVVSYELVEFKMPCEGLAAMILEANKETDDLGPLQLLDNMSRSMFNIIRKCWECDADKRPTATEFVKKWRHL